MRAYGIRLIDRGTPTTSLMFGRKEIKVAYRKKANGPGEFPRRGLLLASSRQFLSSTLFPVIPAKVWISGEPSALASRQFDRHRLERPCPFPTGDTPVFARSVATRQSRVNRALRLFALRFPRARE